VTRRAVDHADVLVIGGGDAGLMAAIDAADRGASVIVLQKTADVGGKSTWAIGSITAAATSLQRERGIRDSVSAHLYDLLGSVAAHEEIRPTIRKLSFVIRHVPRAVDRLRELGVQFSGPHPDHGHTRYRTHVFSPHSMAVVSLLADRARERGVRIRCDSPADLLLVGDGGQVIGAQAGSRAVLARGGVILASGDYSAAHPGTAARDGAEFAFRPWSSGDGQHMAAKVGAVLDGLQTPLRFDLRMLDWPYLRPEPFLYDAGAILVTRTGRRVGNELALDGARVASGHDEDLFVVFDGRVAGRLATAADDSPHARDGWHRLDKLYISTFPGLGYAYLADVLGTCQAATASSVPALARALGIDADGLDREVTRYNDVIRRSAADEFGRGDRHPLERAPFAGLGPCRYRCFNGSVTVRCDSRMRALDRARHPVPGLFVAGATGFYGSVGGHGYSLAWAFVSGTVAGAEAARRAGALKPPGASAAPTAPGAQPTMTSARLADLP
jgi:fumarate reductase flavoprotein subunit